MNKRCGLASARFDLQKKDTRLTRYRAAVVVLLVALYCVAMAYHGQSLRLRHAEERAMQYADELDTANERADKNEAEVKRLRAIPSGANPRISTQVSHEASPRP